MRTYDTTWAGDEAFRAPTWLRRLSVMRDEGSPPALFRGVVERFRSLEHLGAPLDGDAPATAQLEALAARHPGLRSLEIVTAARGASTAALASLPLVRVTLSARLLAGAEGSWSAGLGGVGEVEIRAREVTRVVDAQAWAGLRSCASLDLLHVELDAASLRALAGLPALRSLTLRHCAIEPGALGALAASPSLTRLTVTGAAVSPADAAALAGASGLKIASFAIGSLADARALAPIAERGVALGVSLIGRTRVDDELIAGICAALPGLAGLSLDQHQMVGLTKKLSPEGLAPIGGLTGLRWLSLDGIYVRGIKPGHLGFLGALPGLRSLSLRNAGKLSAAVVDALTGARSLRALDLRGVPLSDAAAKKLGHLGLVTLALSDVKLGPRGFASLAAISTLAELSVEHAVGFSDAMLAALAGARSLTWLDLGASVTVKQHPTTLAPLAGLPALRTLAIAEVGLADAWLESLAGAPALTSLRFTRRDPAFCGGQVSDHGALAAFAVETLETVEAWRFTPSARAQAAIEAAGRGAWVPGGYGRWLSIEAPEEAPLLG